MNDKRGIGFFERYLSVWVALCIIVGIAVGQLLPIIPETLGKWEYANVSIPIAVLIWLMIYPMMLKVDFQSVKNVGKRLLLVNLWDRCAMRGRLRFRLF